MEGRLDKHFGDRGYGFVAGRDGRRYFLHSRQLAAGLLWAEIPPGALLEFDAQPPTKGGGLLEAVNARVLSIMTGRDNGRENT